MEAKNRLTALACCLAFVFMVGFSFAAVPLYQLFCQVTGFGGTPRINTTAQADAVVSSHRAVQVRFDANTQRNMGWEFSAPADSVAVPIGKSALAFYQAHNPHNEAITGMATFNVLPAKAAIYFNKVECFCFEEQTLAPQQSMEFPVSFFIDPAFLTDETMADVREIVLSYTFFPVAQLAEKQ